MLDDFIQFVRGPEGRFLGDAAEIIIARAPGRLDLMGGIADYSGALVLQYPIALAAHVALAKSDELKLEITSVLAGPSSSKRRCEINLEEFLGWDYRTAREWFKADSKKHWAAYVAGCFLVLHRELGVTFDRGARILIRSDVPEGKGVSSSAALEVASMQAVAAAFNVAIEPATIALLCQKVENLVAGAPCGVMDQMTAACGEKDRLLELLCRPARLLGTLRLPEELAIWGLDSGIRHSVGASDYGTVRTAAFMGLAMIERMREAPIEYLTEITPEEFTREFAKHLPRSVPGSEFLSKYDGTRDAVTSVEPDRSYPVYEATRHPIDEHSRVARFREILQSFSGFGDAEELGRLMYDSHSSYSQCGLGSDGTDRIVDLVRAAEPSRGLFGAKITGGGSGGTVAVLGRRDADKAVREIADSYSKKTTVITGSSQGTLYRLQAES